VNHNKSAKAGQDNPLHTGVSADDNGQPADDYQPPDHLCEMPPLPTSAAIDADVAAEASIWLDEYITWSQTWAPRAFQDFHEAAALFLLSTVAARRVRIDLGPGMYTSLYMALIARTTLYTKSTVADLAIAFLRQAGLGYLLAHDDATPQAFIKSLTAVWPENYDDLTPEQQELVRRRLTFAAQRGWFYEEWGQHLDAMMQREGVMASFRGILRRFDDHKSEYSYETISRGVDTVQKPYVTLLANATPADVAPFMQPGGKLWRDGFLARIGLVVPPEESQTNEGFPDEVLTFPPTLVRELRQWHEALHEPTLTLNPILSKAKQPTGLYRPVISPLLETGYRLTPEVRGAFYAYDAAMRHMLTSADTQDFDGSYGRFPIKALRIAALLASMHDVNATHTIDLSHWYRGQAIAERWRASLHRLVGHLQSSVGPDRTAQRENHILKVLKAHGPCSEADIYRWTKIPATQLDPQLKALLAIKIVRPEWTKRTLKYRYAGP
jgi:Protein of unknown function (DUF3987)